MSGTTLWLTVVTTFTTFVPIAVPGIGYSLYYTLLFFFLRETQRYIYNTKTYECSSKFRLTLLRQYITPMYGTQFEQACNEVFRDCSFRQVYVCHLDLKIRQYKLYIVRCNLLTIIRKVGDFPRQSKCI